MQIKLSKSGGRICLICSCKAIHKLDGKIKAQQFESQTLNYLKKMVT